MAKKTVGGWAPLVDTAGLSMTELLASNDPALIASVQRLRKVAEEEDDVISAFQSFTSNG